MRTGARGALPVVLLAILGLLAGACAGNTCRPGPAVRPQLGGIYANSAGQVQTGGVGLDLSNLLCTPPDPATQPQPGPGTAPLPDPGAAPAQQAPTPAQEGFEPVS